MNLLTIQLMQSCNLKCYYCPTKQWTYPINSPLNNLNNEIILKYLDEYCPPNKWVIELTGGEPSLYSELEELINELTERGYYGLIKTNGILPIPQSKTFKRITAWHSSQGLDKPPKCVDTMLIIRNPKDCWQEKIKYCKDNNIHYIDVHFYEFHLPEQLQTPNNQLQHRNTVINYWTVVYANGQMANCYKSCNNDKNMMQNMLPPPQKNIKKECPYCGNVGGFEIFLPDEWIEIFNRLK